METVEKLRAVRSLREENISIESAGRGEQLAGNLDSSMKKNNMMIRKLKQMHEGNAEAILKEMEKTNQSKVWLSFGTLNKVTNL